MLQDKTAKRNNETKHRNTETSQKYDDLLNFKKKLSGTGTPVLKRSIEQCVLRLLLVRRGLLAS